MYIFDGHSGLYDAAVFVSILLLHRLPDFVDDLFVGEFLFLLLIWVDGFEASVGKLDEERLLHGVSHQAARIIFAVEKLQKTSQVRVGQQILHLHALAKFVQSFPVENMLRGNFVDQKGLRVVKGWQKRRLLIDDKSLILSLLAKASLGFMTFEATQTAIWYGARRALVLLCVVTTDLTQVFWITC